MNIQNNIQSKTTFTSRAPIIKEADKICRRVNTLFPHISPSYSWINFKKPEQYNPLFCRIEDKLTFIRFQADNATSCFNYYKKTLSLIKRLTCANCGELADITYLYCKSKKLKDAAVIGLYGFDKKNNKYIEYDHVAVCFNHGKKKIIIDPWFGFADFVDNCRVKYEQRYHEFFEKFNPDFKLVFKKERQVPLKNDDIEKLTKIFPQIK